MSDFYELQPIPKYYGNILNVKLQLQPTKDMNPMNPDNDLFDGFIDPRRYSSLNVQSYGCMSNQPNDFYNRNVIVAPVTKTQYGYDPQIKPKSKRTKRKPISIQNKASYPASDSEDSLPFENDSRTFNNQNIPVYLYETYNKHNKYLPKITRKVYKHNKQRAIRQTSAEIECGRQRYTRTRDACVAVAESATRKCHPECKETDPYDVEYDDSPACYRPRYRPEPRMQQKCMTLKPKPRYESRCEPELPPNCCNPIDANTRNEMPCIQSKIKPRSELQSNCCNPIEANTRNESIQSKIKPRPEIPSNCYNSIETETKTEISPDCCSSIAKELAELEQKWQQRQSFIPREKLISETPTNLDYDTVTQNDPPESIVIINEDNNTAGESIDTSDLTKPTDYCESTCVEQKPPRTSSILHLDDIPKMSRQISTNNVKPLSPKRSFRVTLTEPEIVTRISQPPPPPLPKKESIISKEIILEEKPSTVYISDETHLVATKPPKSSMQVRRTDSPPPPSCYREKNKNCRAKSKSNKNPRDEINSSRYFAKSRSKSVHHDNDYFTGTKSGEVVLSTEAFGIGDTSGYRESIKANKVISLEHEVCYATTIVTRFPNYTVYEVLRPTHVKPKKLCHITENVFVVKTKEAMKD